MTYEKTAPERWIQLEGERTSFITRCEEYSQMTVVSVCPPNAWDRNNDESNQDVQSIGGQAVETLTNKLMMVLFDPSHPFFRLDPSDQSLAIFAETGANESKTQEVLSVIEKKAIKQMDKKAYRPKINSAVEHLVVVGNSCLHLDEERPRVIPIKNYCTKRVADGQIYDAIICDEVQVCTLSQEILDVIPNASKKDPEDYVNHYRWIRYNFQTKKYNMTQWIDMDKLPDKFNGQWAEENLPYRFLTWKLEPGADYGTGRVETFAGDFRAIQAYSQSALESSILASQHRWLCNQNGTTKPEDFENSANGSVLPGNQGDITLLAAGAQASSSLPVIQSMLAQYTQRIGHGFMMITNVTRQAERVTKEEMLMVANELETGLGGAYGRIAVDLQVPLAKFLLNQIGFKYNNTQYEAMIVTGIDALSRNSELDNMKAWLGDLASVQQLTPNQPVLQGLKIWNIASDLAAARGINTSKYILSEGEIAQIQEMERQKQASALAEQNASTMQTMSESQVAQ